MKRYMFVTIASVLAFLMNWTTPAIAEEARIMIGGSGTGSSFYVYHVAVASAIEKYAPGIIPTVTETGGVRDNIERIIRNQIDIGMSTNVASYECYYGKGLWEGKPHNELRWLWHMNNSTMAIFAREDSGVKSIYDLSGKKFCAGASGSHGEKIIQNIFNLLGIKPDYYRGGYSDAAEALENRQIVGFAKWSSSENVGDSLVVKINATTKLNFLGISSEDLKKLSKEYPYLVPGRIPPNVYKDQNYAVPTFGASGGMLASTHLPPDLGYRICVGVNKGFAMIEKAFPGVKGWPMFEGVVKYSPIPIHAGTVKICKELGIEVPQRLIPPEYK
jgi:TRAP transporter TAXI family solute receptor